MAGPNSISGSYIHRPPTNADKAIVRYNGTSGEVQNSDVIIDDLGNIKMASESYIIANDGRNILGYVGGVLHIGAAEDRSTFFEGWANAIMMIDGEIDYLSLIHIFDGEVRLTNGNLFFTNAGQIYSDNVLIVDYDNGLPRTIFGSEDPDQSTVLRAYHSSITLTEDTISFSGDGIFANSIVVSNGATFLGAKTIFAASAINYASINLVEGITPSLFVSGDAWWNGTMLGFQNGSLNKEIPTIEQSRVTTQFDKTNTTLANITGLTANVAAGKTYKFKATLFTTSNVAGGVKSAIAGTATATSIIYEGFTISAGATTQTRATALATTVGGVTAVTAAYITIEGLITVNAAGTLTVQFAENAAVGTSSVLVGSNFQVQQIS